MAVSPTCQDPDQRGSRRLLGIAACWDECQILTPAKPQTHRVRSTSTQVRPTQDGHGGTPGAILALEPGVRVG